MQAIDNDLLVKRQGDNKQKHQAIVGLRLVCVLQVFTLDACHSMCLKNENLKDR